MKNKADIIEKWVRINPLGMDIDEYVFESVHEDKKGLIIKLVSDKSKDKIVIFFSGYVVSYRNIDEGFYWRSWQKPGNFYLVENSEYITWVVNKASNFGNKHALDLKLKHFVFADHDSVFEVIAGYDPEISFEEKLNNNTKK